MPAQDTIPPVATPLLAVPPSRFTAERDALARRLAESGDPVAATVRKVRRPLGLAWLLNRLARDREGDVVALLDAADRVRAAHEATIAGRGGVTLREADEAFRGATRKLRAAAEGLLHQEGRAPPREALARIEPLLRAAAVGDRAKRDAFRRGLLEREPDIAEVGLPAFSGTIPASAPPSGHQQKAASSTPSARESKRAAAPEPSAAERRRRAAEERAVARALEQSRRTLASAEASAEKARLEAEHAGASDRYPQGRRRSGRGRRQHAHPHGQGSRGGSPAARSSPRPYGPHLKTGAPRGRLCEGVHRPRAGMLGVGGSGGSG